MQPLLKFIVGLCTVCAILTVQPALSQTGSKASKSTAKAKAKAKKKPPSEKPAKVGGPQAPKESSKDSASKDEKAAAAISKVAASPTPKRPPEEAEHVSRYDAAIAPVRDHALTSEDTARIRTAVQSIAEGELAAGKKVRDQIVDPAGRKLIDWYLFRGGYGTASEVRAFLIANPAWPDRTLLTQRSEEALLNSSASPADIKSFYGDGVPTTGVGLATLASALAADGQVVTAKAMAAKAWVEFDISAAHEPAFLKRVGFLLTEADHRRRLDRLLLSATHSDDDRKGRAVVIKRVIALLPAAEKKKAEARLAVFLRAKNSDKLMSKLPPQALESDWGLAVQRAQALRRQKKDEAAWKILLAEPQATLQVKPDGWWEVRRASAYAALRAGKAKTAYDLVRDPGQLSINAHNAAVFMAGWIALRHLNDPKTALTHFESFVKSADGPLTRSRSNYWLGRTHEALGDQAKARQAYTVAAAQIDTFHGQLARLKLDPRASKLEIKPPATPSAEEIARFNGLDALHAAVLAHRAGLDRNLVRSFLTHLRGYLQTEAEVAMLAHLAESIGDTQWSIRIGKAGIARGMNLVYYAYPVHKLPAYTPLRGPAETALLLGVARQESEFNQSTLSTAGARGILQVMPITARHVCRDYKLKCDIPRLMKDAAYNTMMASAYISDRMDEFDGSYVLTLAGYNAGPGRTREWIREFGDPRNPNVDPIDWIHRIPFEETREYVQRVLSNIQMYRARLGEEASVRLDADLRRTSQDASSKAASTK
jgi:soluble lytic murein transglycosylase